MLMCILDLAVLILGTATVISLLKFFLGYEVKEKKTSFIIVGSFFVLFNLLSGIFIADREITELITEVSLVATAMILPYLLLKKRKQLTFVWFGLIICSTFDYLESLAISFFKAPTEYTANIIYIILYGISFSIILLTNRFAKPLIPPDFLEQLSPTIYIVIFFADYSAYYDVMLSKDSAYYTEVSNVLKLISAALIVGCFSYIIYRYSSLSYKQKEAELQLEAELKHYEEMVQKNRDIRTFRHDYKNNLYSLKTLIRSGRIDEAEKYIDELDSGLMLSENKYATGNYLADAIISGKAETAKQMGADIEFEGVIPESGISNNDLCTILSNALDNAVRACAGIAPCKINIGSQITANGASIRISNPVAENVEIKNNSVKTTKSDKTNHGIGIENIKKAVKKYNGYAELSCEDKAFTVEIGLVLKN